MDTDGTPRLLGLRGSQSTRNATGVSGTSDPVSLYQVLVEAWTQEKGKATTAASLWLGQATQPSATCDPTKSPRAGKLGPIVLKEYRICKWKRRSRMVCGLGRGGSQEVRRVRNRLMCVTRWPLKSWEMSGSGL